MNESFVENREMNGILKEENIKMTSLKWEKNMGMWTGKDNRIEKSSKNKM